MQNSKGFSLIEILVTLVVLGVGLVALAKFQGNIVESGALAKARTVAAHIAQQKIDDLRNYEMLAPPTSAAPPASSVFYRDIANNAGGAKSGGAWVIPASSNILVSNVTYSLSWSVENYYYPKGVAGITPNTAATTVPSGSVPQYPDYKKVTVPVTWTDQKGVQQEVRLHTVISAHDPVNSGKILE